MRGSKKAGPVKRRVMRGGGMAKKAGPVKRKMRGGGMAKKAGPVKKKGMRSGGSMRRNLRDEEARVIGRQMMQPVS